MAPAQDTSAALPPAEKLHPTALAEDAESAAPSTELGSDASWSDSDSEPSETDSDWGLTSPFSMEDTLLIFDWDDTLLATRWLEAQGLSIEAGSPPPNEEQSAQLLTLAEHARQTLETAMAHGTVLLVTNAERGWIELSCRRFLPSLWPLVRGLRALSARSAYERRGVAEPSEWKYLAFESEISAFCGPPGLGCRRKNVISIGDSAHERSALIRATERFPNSCAKALKLMEKPDLWQLVQEHQLLGGCIRDVVDYDGSLDVCIRRS